MKQVLRSIRINNVPARTEIFASGKLSFHAFGGADEIICDVTLLRTISTLIPKRTGVLFGRVTGVAIDRGRAPDGSSQEHCRTNGAILSILRIVVLRGRHRELGNGVLLFDLKAPENDRLWKLIYDSFQGGLPEISGLNFHIEKMLFELLFITSVASCNEGLWEGNLFGLITISRRVITGAEAIEGRTRLRKIRGGVICPETYTFSTNFTVSPSNLTIDLL